ncbi:MAG TPA: DUF1365 domain-containing protein [Solirubrobacteraceae bacterium]|nr:DUF1365 domain-containing protein [Solirubrobacteraceae bacterium]
MSGASAIYEGVVAHRRSQPREHAFSYRVAMLYLDLGELPELFDAHPLWSARRPALGWFRRSDYLGDPGVPLDEAVRRLVEERTDYRPAGPVRVLTTARCFGHAFNPVSFYYCFDPAGAQVEAVIAEVTNTPWGERHAYLSRELTSRHAKLLHVSPFYTLDYEYELRLSPPGERLEVSIGAEREGRREFHATLALERRPVTARALAGLLLGGLPMSMKVSAAIYAQALRLRLKGLPVQPHPREAVR